MNSRALILFLRYPEKGRVKTRLAKVLGDDFVLELYQHFIIDILDSCKKVDADIVLAYAGSNGNLSNWPLCKAYNCVFQKGSDLGERMYNVLLEVSSLGYSRLVLIGSDMPDLPAKIISEAFESLKDKDIVLGPSRDGGYYLIGLNRDKTDYSIFRGVPWSTSQVFEKTINNLRSKDVSWKELTLWSDIDDVEDLKHFYDNYKQKSLKSSTMRFLAGNANIFTQAT